MSCASNPTKTPGTYRLVNGNAARREVLGHVILITTRRASDDCGTTWTWRTVSGPVRSGGTGHAYASAHGARLAAIDSALNVLGSRTVVA